MIALRNKGEFMSKWKKNLWLLWLAQLISISSFGFGLPFIPLYIQDLALLTKQELTLYTTIISAAPAITMGFMAPVWGYLADKYGRKLMIMRATLSGAFIVGMMGLVTSIHQLLVLRFMQGLFTGTVTAATAFVAADAPEEELGYAMGVITSGNFVGFSFGPLVGGIFAKYFGYRMSYFLGGAMLFLSFLIVYFFVCEDRDKLYHKEKGGKAESLLSSYKSVLGPIVLSSLIIYFFLRISRTAFNPCLPIYVQSYIAEGRDVPLITGLINGLTSLVTALSSILLGKLSQKYDVTKLLKLSILLSFLATLGLCILVLKPGTHTGLNALIPFILNYVVFFFFIGGVEPSITSLSACSVSPDHRGALFGLQGAVGSLAWFTAPLLSGSVAYYFDIIYVIPIMVLGVALMGIATHVLTVKMKREAMKEYATAVK